MRPWLVRLVATVVLSGSLVAVAGGATSTAAPTVDGREWRELHETTGLSWSQVASVCPTDGKTPCSGAVAGRDLTGWTWATAAQVRDLMADHAPGLATADPPVVSGIDGFWGANSFLGVMRWTTYTSLTYFYSEYTAGWTATTTDAGSGLPVAGAAGYSHALAGSTADGSIGLGPEADQASAVRGVFLWRPADGDYTAPVVSPTVTGTLGDNGWYRSDVTVSWDVSDDSSPIVSREGCDPVTLAVDDAGTTFTCTATSAGQGGPGSASVTVKRDTTRPRVACASAPTFELGQSAASVSAAVKDGLSGPVSPSVSKAVPTSVAGVHSTSLTGVDRAGNIRSRSCSYTVVTPQCQGATPTILGTGGNDVIRGTAGADVIHALGGADTVRGLGSADTLCGGSGDDEIHGGPGPDTLDGGAGSDSLRGDDGADRCTSGELRTSSCAVIF